MPYRPLSVSVLASMTVPLTWLICTPVAVATMPMPRPSSVMPSPLLPEIVLRITREPDARSMVMPSPWLAMAVLPEIRVLIASRWTARPARSLPSSRTLTI